MNKIQFVVAKATVILCLLGYIAHPVYAYDNIAYASVPKDILKERLKTLYSPVDLRYTEEVHQIIDSYIRKNRRSSERLLGLSERFFPLYESEFRRQGLPEELKYLSVVESGLRPNVVSHAGAAGLWQFMKGTSRLYGLTTNSAVDERRDPIRSTQAATQYLKDLYDQFGDWTLALAAYNCGPGNVKKALRRSSKDEFWSLKNYLPKETRRYIPKYVAISYIMSYSHAHGLTPVLDYDINTFITVKVYDYTKLKDVSNLSGLEYEAVKALNSAFLKNYIPKSSKGYFLTLPEINMYNYLAQVGGWEHLRSLNTHSESLKQTYYRYGAMKRQLESLMPLNDTKELLQVMSLNPLNKLPQLPLSDMVIQQHTPLFRTSKEHTYHKLSAQQSISDVAKLWKIPLDELLQLNNVDINNPPAPGSFIRVQ